MLELGKGIQIVLQTETVSGRFRCEGFSGIPVVNPCFIVIATSKSKNALQEAERLRQELISAILNLSANAHFIDVPCGGNSPNIRRCHAHRVDVCQKLLVLVGDATTTFSTDSGVDQWADNTNNDPHYHILPIFPKGAPIGTLLPKPLRHFNAVPWSNSIAEIIPEVFAAVGLTANEFRIFISYRRADTQHLADQLFDALSHENFDVYLDRFRNPPAVNFPIRLLQELADKSMVLVLESPNILKSTWTQYEIAFAKLYRLGLLALNVPGSIRLSSIDPKEREILVSGDFNNPGTCDTLTQTALQRVVERIKVEHDKALVRRRQMIRDSMKYALLLAGVYHHSIGADGLLHVQPRGTGSSKQYSIWLTTRPPSVSDFHLTDVNRKPVETGIVIGPAMYEPTRKARTDWLAEISKVKQFDEGFMWQVAQEIARETL